MRLTAQQLDALEAALKYYDETGIDKVDYDALPLLIAAARLTVPEPIGEKHKKGDYWQVWVPEHKQWVKCCWYADSFWLVYGGYALDGTPTHALPMPPPIDNQQQTKDNKTE